VVQTTEVLGAAPTALGGSIASGLYYLADVTLYRSKAGPADTYQSTLQIGASNFAERAYEHGLAESPISGTYAINGTTLQRNITCPVTNADVDQFTATATTLTIYLASTGCFPGTTVLTFQLQ
jgi:hypothetical protein